MGNLAIDLTGRKFGRLTVAEMSPTRAWQKVHWVCRCDCGSEVIVDGTNLRKGKTRSCGCLREEYRQRQAIEATENTPHGTARSYNGSRHCRCELCRAAWAEYMRDKVKRSRRNGGEGEATMGTVGRPPKATEDEVAALLAKGLTATDIAAKLGISRQTFYRIASKSRTASNNDTRLHIEVRPVSEMPRTSPRTTVYADIIAAIRQLPAGQCVRVKFPPKRSRRDFVRAFRQKAKEAECPVTMRTVGNYLWIAPVEAKTQVIREAV